MTNAGEQHADDRRLHARRDVLAGATYGLGVALLFGHRVADAVTHPGGQGRPVTPRAAEHRWNGRDATRLARHGQPRSVCKGRAAVLVVGVGSGGDPVSWSNTGDARWLEHTLAQPAPGEPDVWGVAAHGGQFVAVGSTLQREEREVTADSEVPGELATVTFTSSRRLPTVWWTADGERWAGRVLDDDDRHAQLVSVSCHSDLLVAVGSTLDADGVQGDGALVMTSHDHGRTWRRGEIAPGDATLAEGSFTGVTLVGGRWFATSTDIEGGTVWSSDDGLRWATLPRSARQFRGIALQGIAARRDRVYVAGTSLIDQTPRYYCSADRCRTWQRMRPGPRALSGPDVIVNDLTVVADDVVVVGTHRGAPIIEGGSDDAAN